jgi:hypothetical protein
MSTLSQNESRHVPGSELLLLGLGHARLKGFHRFFEFSARNHHFAVSGRGTTGFVTDSMNRNHWSIGRNLLVGGRRG